MELLIQNLKQVCFPGQLAHTLSTLQNITNLKLNNELLLLLKNILKVNNKNLQQYNGLLITINILKNGLKYSEYKDADWLKLSGPICDLIMEIYGSIIDYQNTSLIKDKHFCKFIIQASSVLLTASGDNFFLRYLVTLKCFNKIISLVCLSALDFAIRKEILLLFKPLVVKAEFQLKKQLLNDSDELFTQLSELVFHCGDYETQESIVEILMRFSIMNKQKLEKLSYWFSKHNVSHLIEILDYRNFDISCRNFLNKINEITSPTPGRVITLPCLEAFANEIKLKKPHEEKYMDLWVDFSCSTGMIHMICDSGESAWLKIFVEKHNVENISCYKRSNPEQSMINKILLKLKSPLQVQLYSVEKLITNLSLSFSEGPKFIDLQKQFFEKWHSEVYKVEISNMSIRPQRDSVQAVDSVLNEDTNLNETQKDSQLQNRKRVPLSASTPKLSLENCTFTMKDASSENKKSQMKIFSNFEDISRHESSKINGIRSTWLKSSFHRLSNEPVPANEGEELKGTMENKSRSQLQSVPNKGDEERASELNVKPNLEHQQKDNINSVDKTHNSNMKVENMAEKYILMSEISEDGEEDSPFRLVKEKQMNTCKTDTNCIKSLHNKLSTKRNVSELPKNCSETKESDESDLQKLKKLFTERNYVSMFQNSARLSEKSQACEANHIKNNSVIKSKKCESSNNNIKLNNNILETNSAIKELSFENIQKSIHNSPNCVSDRNLKDLESCKSFIQKKKIGDTTNFAKYFNNVTNNERNCSPATAENKNNKSKSKKSLQLETSYSLTNILTVGSNTEIIASKQPNDEPDVSAKQRKYSDIEKSKKFNVFDFDSPGSKKFKQCSLRRRKDAKCREPVEGNTKDLVNKDMVIGTSNIFEDTRKLLAPKNEVNDKENMNREQINSQRNKKRQSNYNIFSPDRSFHCRIPLKTYTNKPLPIVKQTTPEKIFQSLKDQQSRMLQFGGKNSDDSVSKKRKLFNPTDSFEEVASEGSSKSKTSSETFTVLNSQMMKNIDKVPKRKLLSRLEKLHYKNKTNNMKMPKLFEDGPNFSLDKPQENVTRTRKSKRLMNKKNYKELSSENSEEIDFPSVKITTQEAEEKKHVNNHILKQNLKFENSIPAKNSNINDYKSAEPKKGTLNPKENKNCPENEDLPSKLKKLDEDMCSALREDTQCELRQEELPIEEVRSPNSPPETVQPPLRLSFDDSRCDDSNAREIQPENIFNDGNTSGTQKDVQSEIAFLNSVLSHVEKISVNTRRQKILSQVDSLDASLKRILMYTQSNDRSINKMFLDTKAYIEKMVLKLEKMTSLCEEFIEPFKKMTSDVTSIANRLTKNVILDQDLKRQVAEDIEKLCSERRMSALVNDFRI